MIEEDNHQEEANQLPQVDEEPIIETSNPFGMEVEGDEEEDNKEELERMDNLEKEKKEFVEVLRKDTPIKSNKKEENVVSFN